MLAKGLMNKDTLFIHGLMMTERDRRVLIDTGASISLALGTDYTTGRGDQARQLLVQMIQAGGNVSLSCDASSLTPTSMFEQMRMAWYLSSPQVGTDIEIVSGPTPQQILAMGTRNALRGLAFGDIGGTLTPGKRADIVLLNARALNLAPVGDELDKAILHSAMPHNVETVIVDGKALKWKGKILNADVEMVRQEAVEALYSLRRKAGGELTPKTTTAPLL
jgi:cytosine/adenosine deaminase-related metal-dependent hydrolase